MKKINLLFLIYCILVSICYTQESDSPVEVISDVSNSSVKVSSDIKSGDYCFYDENYIDVVDNQTRKMLHEIRRRNGYKDDSPVYRETSVTKKNFFADGRTAFALGFVVSASAANSYFNVEDFFKKTLEINLAKMAEDKKGLSFSGMALVDFYLDIYIKSKYEFGIFSNTDVFAYNNIPHDLINFLGNGMFNETKLKGNISEYAYAFIDLGTFYGMKINSFKFRTSASYFIPLMYCNSVIGEYEYYNDPSTGEFRAFGKTDINLYSSIPLSGQPVTKKDIDNIFSGAGFDITFHGSYDLPPYADIHFSLCNIPIVPGNLSKGIKANYQGKLEVSSLVETVNKIIDGNFEQPDVTVDFDQALSYELNKKLIFRPLKFTVGSNIYPLKNKYLIITPSLGLHVLKPVYVDFGLRLESQFLNVMGLYYSLNRLDRVYKNTLGFFFDLRVFRLELAASSASPSFVGSLKGKGMEAYLQLVFGY